MFGGYHSITDVLLMTPSTDDHQNLKHINNPSYNSIKIHISNSQRAMSLIEFHSHAPFLQNYHGEIRVSVSLFRSASVV